MSGRLFLLLACALITAPARAQVSVAPPVPQWIQCPAASDTNTTVRFARQFVHEGALLKSVLLVAGDTPVSVELNGERIAGLEPSPRAAGVDVTKHVRPGTNALVLATAGTSPRVSALLEVNGDFARQRWIASDGAWLCWTQSATATGALAAVPVKAIGRVDADPKTNPFDPARAFDAYNSWKMALGSRVATDPDTFELRPGFRAELLRSAQANEGSWVAMAFDPQGRLTLARESKGLLRLEFTRGTVSRVEEINNSLLECRGLLYAFGALYANANNSKALCRLRDTSGGVFDVEVLLRTGGGVGHGRNHLKLGPGEKLYIAHGNNVLPPTNAAPGSPLRNFAEDQLIPCPWDPSWFDGDVLVPAGHVLRSDRDGRLVDLFAGGFRNQLDVAFNEEGEMFTFDADMEWDVGAPWYMPNRVLHVVSGADFGFRRGTGRFAEYYPDTLPTAVPIGLASPTALTFGYGSRFPEKYRRALFICDWAYGRILAVHLKPEGASYTGSFELFVSGRPLNVTDAVIGPDGAMYFITGGRTTQSGLYRITHHGADATTPAAGETDLRAAELRRLRRRLEEFHSGPDDPLRALAEIWPHLGHEDRWIRHAARVALEHQPVALWRERALAETNLTAALNAALALARLAAWPAEEPVVRRLLSGDFSALTEEQRLGILRASELTFIRQPTAGGQLSNALARVLEANYPTASRPVNREACKILVYLQSPLVIAKTLPLLDSSADAEDLLHFVFLLRYMREGWTTGQRRELFHALNRLEGIQGGRQTLRAVKDIRAETAAALTGSERSELSSLLAPAHTAALQTNSSRALVKEWTIEDFSPLLDRAASGRSFERGKQALIDAQCVACHRVTADPAVPAGIIGPDLTGVAGRFGRRDLLEHTLDPSKVVDEKFRSVVIRSSDGTEIVGTIEREDELHIVLRTNPFTGDTQQVSRRDIRERTFSTLSPMPAGLLNVLTAEEILDLLAFLEAGGERRHAVFQRP